MSINESTNSNNKISPFLWGMNPRFWSTPSVFIKDIYLLNIYDDNLIGI